jgi:hypothetical protein
MYTVLLCAGVDNLTPDDRAALNAAGLSKLVTFSRIADAMSAEQGRRTGSSVDEPMWCVGLVAQEVGSMLIQVLADGVDASPFSISVMALPKKGFPGSSSAGLWHGVRLLAPLWRPGALQIRIFVSAGPYPYG